jgi:hypothetical protein
MTTTSSKSLAWSHGVVSVETLGGMLGPTLFVLADGHQIAPFHIAPWFEGDQASDQPGILRRLRGEWPCVPFGAAGNRAAQGGWPASDAALEPDPAPHGHGSNHHWHWADAAETEIALAIDYPVSHPISRLSRRVLPVADQAAIDFELSIQVRRDCTLPIGLHPVFRLPAQPGAMLLDIEAKAGATFPGQVDPSSIFAPGQIVADWHTLALKDGSSFDAGAVPFSRRTEDLLQLLGTRGHAALRNLAESYRVRLEWDESHFPDLLLWFSNFGRAHPPWNGRHLALGVEPVCSAFDLGCQISSQPNPINARGNPTARVFRAGEVFVTRYRVSVDPL